MEPLSAVRGIQSIDYDKEDYQDQRLRMDLRENNIPAGVPLKLP